MHLENALYTIEITEEGIVISLEILPSMGEKCFQKNKENNDLKSQIHLKYPRYL